jgi:hypothetical protein
MVVGFTSTGAISGVDNGFEQWSGLSKDYTNGIFHFSYKYIALRSERNTGWLGIMIICQRRVICLPAGCCFISKQKKYRQYNGQKKKDKHTYNGR